MYYIPNDCFSGLLSAAMELNGVNGTQLQEMLISHGVENITYKRISDYRNGVYTPSFDKARQMMDVLKYPIDDEALRKAIELNRELVKEDKSNKYIATNSYELRKSIRLKLEGVLPGLSSEETEALLYQRVANLCGDESQMSAYLRGLIAKDLREYIMTEDDLITTGK